MEIANMKKHHDITLTIEVSYEHNNKTLPIPDTFIVAFDDNNCRLDTAQVKKQCATLKLPADSAGQFIRLFHASSEFDIKESASLVRLQRYRAVEKRFFVDNYAKDLRLVLPKFDLTLWTRACCRVRGDVSLRITMPNKKVRFAPLCNARLQIYEVDHSFPLLIWTLPDHLIYRLRDDWKAAIKNPLKLLNNQPEIAATAEGIRQALAPAKNLTLSESQLKIRKTIKPLFKLNTATELRKAFIDNLVLLRPFLCFFDWMLHELDLLKTVDIDADGSFDTHIYYPCFGDKPDLYFKVQQSCHPEEWLTVYEPSIHCSTYWDYCCGSNIKIQVSHPRAAAGLSIPECDFSAGANDPAVIGQSALLPYETPFNVAHIALMHTGEVMLIPGHQEGGDLITSTVWNPDSELIGDFDTPTPDNQVTEPLYCCHHVFLADGRLLTIGGGGNAISSKIRSTWIFDPHLKKWTKVKDMENKRWYPTAVLLQDGRVLAVSGDNVEQVEVYDPDTNDWDVVKGADHDFNGIYPGLHLLPSGDIIFTRTGWNEQHGANSALLHFTGAKTGVWHEDHPMKYADHHEGMSVILIRRHVTEFQDNVIAGNPVPLDQPVTYARVLVIGGGGLRWGEINDGNPSCPDKPGKSVEKIDFPPAFGAAAWSDAKDLFDKRCNGNAVLLPDGNVLVCGGVIGSSIGCEIYDPENNIWLKAAPLKAQRMYHSNALLLPSGKILITGGSTDDKLKMELYSPPYLFRGPRPTYTVPDSHIHHNNEFSINSPDACRIKQIGLMRPSATTHQTDSEQRYILMDFKREGKCELIIQSPENGAIAPPGHYMLFIVDDCGIPSEARFIDLH
jgi:galactose oxidase-like protein/Kelch motif protein